MSEGPKAVLHRYLQVGRDAALWKLEGLSEYDARRPLTPTGTNLLGVVKHLASVEIGYFGDVWGRPFPEDLPWLAEGAAENDDMWATADQSREYVTDLYRRAWAHSDATIGERDLDAPTEVPWWGPQRRHTTLHTLLVHMIAETHRHLGQFDILREQVDGAVGHRRELDNMASGDEAAWAEYRAKLEDVARRFR
ncbi:DinB family protein [Saccharothrix syringae]|uniref:DinB family protein n=1 Tax=Saccharothrix syringae TaxID=103733 RepID=A0A5Q0GUQ5_SACSY|nr:DinB family protein [Saccharothrix syringae]QFZ17689.1 DinB family protein [Saccharothrix syringae]